MIAVKISFGINVYTFVQVLRSCKKNNKVATNLAGFNTNIDQCNKQQNICLVCFEYFHKKEQPLE